MFGDIIVLAKFIVPVRKAKMVPSILGGVILAKSARIGKLYKITPITEKTTSVKSKNAISGIPISRFHLFAKQNYKKAPTAPTIIAKNIIHLVSTFLHHALYIRAPMMWQICPISTNIAKTNFDILISFNKKK